MLTQGKAARRQRGLSPDAGPAHSIQVDEAVLRCLLIYLAGPQ